MVVYSEIAHLCQHIRVTPSEAHIRIVSDCGKFEQFITMIREQKVAEVEPLVGSTSVLIRWVRAALRRVLEDVSCPSEALELEELERLSLQAFEQVSGALTKVDGRWVALAGFEHPSEFFERQLSSAPITEPFDQEVMIRVLLEVSRSDSEWRKEEKLFLEEIVGDLASVSRLHKAPNLTIAELAEVSSVGVKQSILMLAWAMAYADGTLDVQEMTRLTHICRGFMLPEQRVRELQLAAKLSLLDRYLEAQRRVVGADELRANFDAKALEWGICEQNLCQLRAWYPADFPEDSLVSAPLKAGDEF